MPKRKANESADDAVGLGGEKEQSPRTMRLLPRARGAGGRRWPRRKDWHDARSTASSGGGGGAPAGPGVDQSNAEDAISPRREGGREALAAAREWHDARSSSTSSGGVAFATAPRRTGAVDDGGKVVGVPPRSVASSSRSDEYECAPPVVDVAVAAPPAVRKPDDNISNQSALYRDALPTMGVGGERLPEIVERGRGDMKVSTSRSENTTATATMTTSIAESMGGSTSTYSSSTRLAYPAKDFLGIVGKSLLFLALFALNITTAIVAIVVIRGSSSSFDALRERHASEVDALVTRISKSREVEALLRSGVGVLEREMQARRNAGGGIDSDDVRAMYGIRTESSIDDAADYDIRSVEERNDWLEGMRALEEERSLGLEKLNAMRIALFEDGRF